MPIIDLVNVAEHDLVLVLHPSRHCNFLCWDNLHVALTTTTYNVYSNNEHVLFQNLTILDRSRFVTRDRSSSVKKMADLSGCSGRGHMVLVCTKRRRPRPLFSSKQATPAPRSTDRHG